MKLLCVLLLALVSAVAQTTTTVTGTLADAFGNVPAAKLAATCAIRTSATFNAAAGWVVAGGTGHIVRVVDGALSMDLVPTDTAQPVGRYYEMRCHVPLQTAAGVSCEGSASLLSQGVCTVGPGDWGPIYLLVPTSSSPVNLKDIYRVRKPQGITWQQLLDNGTTWGQLLQGGL